MLSDNKGRLHTVFVKQDEEVEQLRSQLDKVPRYQLMTLFLTVMDHDTDLCSFFIVVQNSEIAELHNQLDKYRTVAAVTFPVTASGAETGTEQKTRAHRALGISAEPLTMTTVDDIMSGGTSSAGAKSKRKSADTINALSAEIDASRHPKAPA